ncbi:MAG: hypothetical protein ACOCRX_06695 [Candidatus Woesearchaeota archaeon]
MFLSKRGLSGVVFTIFIVAIILSIGTILLGWVTSYSYDSVLDSELNTRIDSVCSNLDILTIRVIIDDMLNESHPNHLNNDSEVSVLLENNGREVLKGIVIRAYPDNEEKLYSEIIERDLNRHSRYSYEMNLFHKIDEVCNPNEGPSNCHIERVEFIPMVEVDFDGKDIYECSNHVKGFKRSDSIVKIPQV